MQKEVYDFFILISFEKYEIGSARNVSNHQCVLSLQKCLTLHLVDTKALGEKEREICIFFNNIDDVI